jgi:pimeloyl-ACP methyl ester carboxylesterase
MQPSNLSNSTRLHLPAWLAAIILFSACLTGRAASDAPPTYAQLVERFRALQSKEAAFGPVYQPLYHAAIKWYIDWGNHTNDPADAWFVAPNVYAAEFADAVEHGTNFIAEHLGGGIPLAFEAKLPDGTLYKANYQLSFPAGFPEPGKKFPLIIGLHGSGWLGHKISYVRGGPASGARAFGVTPIDQRGPWRLDFLNAYLDELLRILPVNPDQVYVEGHSLGAMATWDWAMNNPERFAAISPRDGSGSAFRAARLKNVPVWVVHGGADDTILPGYADQMVTALQAVGATVKYSLLKDAPHNLPPDFNEQAVVTWYLGKTRSHDPVPPDPLDALSIGTNGISDTAIITLPAQWFWKSETAPLPTARDRRFSDNSREKVLFKKIEDQGALVDSPIRQEIDPAKHLTTLWLAVPDSIHGVVSDDASIVKLPERTVARFYCRGDSRTAIAHMTDASAKLKSEGKTVADTVWLTTLTPDRRGSNNISECWIELH